MSTALLTPATGPAPRPEHDDAQHPTDVLAIKDLHVAYRRAAGPAVDGLSLSIGPGEVVALVGESGSGKSTTASAVVRTLPGSAAVSGSLLLEGEDLTHLSERELRGVLGSRIGYVPQDPMTSLDPVRTVGSQIDEVLRLHQGLDRAAARERSVEVLAEVGITEPARRYHQYPHELSGGMRQRVLLGIALAADPVLLIADEPTSGLDVTVQRTVLDRLAELTAQHGTSVLLITHNLGVAYDRADRVLVMRHGEIVESGTSEEVLHHPRHAYTRDLLAAAPSLGARPLIRREPAPAAQGHGAGADTGTGEPGRPLLEVRDVTRVFGDFTAVDHVSVSIPAGRTLGVVGESGSGKTTLARIIADAAEPSTGEVLLDGRPLSSLGRAERRERRRRVQYVHQNPYLSLDPRLSVEAIVREPLDSFRVGSRRERRARVAELLELVALDGAAASRSPVELSGGQRQRVAIARALALSPDLVVLDEPVSALDVSVQDQVLRLLADLQEHLGVAYLFISHDLAVVRLISDHVAVMQGGRVVEPGTAQAVLDHPEHPYTRALLDAVPGPRERPAAPPTNDSPTARHEGASL